MLAKLTMNDDVYHLVKNTPKVTGFLGPNGKPQAISEAEAARILDTKEEAAAAAPKQKISVDYEIGDAVKVLDGPFASFNGVVEELDFDRSRVKVQCLDFRPRDAGRAGVRTGRARQVAPAQGALTASFDAWIYAHDGFPARRFVQAPTSRKLPMREAAFGCSLWTAKLEPAVRSLVRGAPTTE